MSDKVTFEEIGDQIHFQRQGTVFAIATRHEGTNLWNIDIVGNEPLCLIPYSEEKVRNLKWLEEWSNVEEQQLLTACKALNYALKTAKEVFEITQDYRVPHKLVETMIEIEKFISEG